MDGRAGEMKLQEYFEGWLVGGKGIVFLLFLQSEMSGWTNRIKRREDVTLLFARIIIHGTYLNIHKMFYVLCLVTESFHFVLLEVHLHNGNNSKHGRFIEQIAISKECTMLFGLFE